MAEIAELTPDFAGVTYERIGRRGLQWPVAPDGTDSPMLFDRALRAPGRPRPPRGAPVQAAGRRGRATSSR